MVVRPDVGSKPCTGDFRTCQSQGREWDAHRQDYYFRNRIYVPEWGSFTGPDMNLANGIEGEPNGVGNYVFCNNDPLDNVDPLGLYPMATPENVNNGFGMPANYPGGVGAWNSRLSGDSRKSLPMLTGALAASAGAVVGTEVMIAAGVKSSVATFAVSGAAAGAAGDTADQLTSMATGGQAKFSGKRVVVSTGVGAGVGVGAKYAGDLIGLVGQKLRMPRVGPTTENAKSLAPPVVNPPAVRVQHATSTQAAKQIIAGKQISADTTDRLVYGLKADQPGVVTMTQEAILGTGAKSADEVIEFDVSLNELRMNDIGDVVLPSPVDLSARNPTRITVPKER